MPFILAKRSFEVVHGLPVAVAASMLVVITSAEAGAKQPTPLESAAAVYASDRPEEVLEAAPGRIDQSSRPELPAPGSQALLADGPSQSELELLRRQLQRVLDNWNSRRSRGLQSRTNEMTQRATPTSPLSPTLMNDELQRVQRALGGSILDQPHALSGFDPPREQAFQAGSATANRTIEPTRPIHEPSTGWGAGVRRTGSSLRAPEIDWPQTADKLQRAMAAPVQVLRDTGRRLEESANQLETFGLYSEADKLRELAQSLRVEARNIISTPPVMPAPIESAPEAVPPSKPPTPTYYPADPYPRSGWHDRRRDQGTSY